MSKCLTRFSLEWAWDGKPTLIQSRAMDDTGYVQPTYKQLRAVRGSRSIYHNNAVQTWLVQESGEVKNVQTSCPLATEPEPLGRPLKSGRTSMFHAATSFGVAARPTPV